MDPFTGLAISTAAIQVLKRLDWAKAANTVLVDCGKVGVKALWTRLKPDERERIQKRAIALFIENFCTELQDKCLFTSALEGYKDQLKLLVEAATSELVAWANPEIVDIDLTPVKCMWEGMGLVPLPENFDWTFLAKSYARDIRKLIKSDDHLRELLHVALQEQMVEINSRIAGPNDGFDLLGYRDFIRRRYAGLQLSLLHPTTYKYDDRQVTLWSIFVPQRARASVPSSELPHAAIRQLHNEGYNIDSLSDLQLDESRKDFASSPVRPILSTVASERLLVILGDPGSGKTALLNYVALRWAEKSEGSIPFRIDLKEYAQLEPRTGFLKFLGGGSGTFHFDLLRIDRLFREEEVLLLLDGLDEIFDLAIRNLVMSDIIAFVSQYASARVIVTSRLLGYEPERLNVAGFGHVTLEDFDNAEVDQFIKAWHEAAERDPGERALLSSRLRSAIQDAPPIRELAGNPLLLTMMAILNRTQALPRNRAELYLACSQVLVHEWDTRRTLPDHTLDYQDKTDLLRKLAGHMQENEQGLAGNLIERPTLVKLFRDFLIGLGISNHYTKAIELVTQLTERNFMLCYAGAGRFCFVHRTFLEFFCASWFVHRYQVERTLTLEDLLGVFEQHWKEETWHEVLSLVVGMVGSQDQDAIITYLIDQDGRRSGQLNLRLAARCFLEVRKRPMLINTEMRLRKRIMEDVCHYESCPSTWSVRGEDYHAVREQGVSLVASLWHTPEIYSWLEELVRSDFDEAVRGAAIKEIARGWKEQPHTLALLQQFIRESGTEFLRGVAIETLVQNWPDDTGTVPLLSDLIANDSSSYIQGISVSELAHYWRGTPATKTVLLDLACTRIQEHVGRVAMEELVLGWRDDLEILPLVLRNVEHFDECVRGLAVETFARAWTQHADMHPILTRLLSTDKSEFVRAKVVERLARGRRHRDDTLPLLLASLSQDRSDYVRETILEELGLGWKGDPEIAAVLLQLSCSKKTRPSVREAAIMVLGRYWETNPDTTRALLTLAQSDGNASVREAALKAFATRLHKSTETELIIRDISENDKDLTVREAAAEILDQWANSPKNLVSSGLSI